MSPRGLWSRCCSSSIFLEAPGRDHGPLPLSAVHTLITGGPPTEWGRNRANNPSRLGPGWSLVWPEHVHGRSSCRQWWPHRGCLVWLECAICPTDCLSPLEPGRREDRRGRGDPSPIGLALSSHLCGKAEALASGQLGCPERAVIRAPNTPVVTCQLHVLSLRRVATKPALGETQRCDTKGETSRKLKICIVPNTWNMTIL